VVTAVVGSTPVAPGDAATTAAGSTLGTAVALLVVALLVLASSTAAGATSALSSSSLTLPWLLSLSSSAAGLLLLSSVLVPSSSLLSVLVLLLLSLLSVLLLSSEPLVLSAPTFFTVISGEKLGAGGKAEAVGERGGHLGGATDVFEARRARSDLQRALVVIYKKKRGATHALRSSETPFAFSAASSAALCTKVFLWTRKQNG